MAESTDTAPSAGGGAGNKLKQFIKKNKTLSIVIGAVGGYFAWKELSKNSGGAVEEEPTEGIAEAAIGGPQSAMETSHEAIDDEINRIDEEAREEREERERIEHENENKGEGGGPAETEPGGGDTEPTTPATPDAPGVTVHGKLFMGATGSRIAKAGVTGGGKHYIEYVISFPGRQEHWQYFTASGNWRMVNDSSTGAGQSKPPRAQPDKGSGVKPGGGGGSSQPKREAVAPAKPVAGPPSNAEHDRAVREINRLQGEIDGLQNHINQLTNAIQAHPKAQQRGQWENERNSDRANIDHKRNEITYWRARL